MFIVVWLEADQQHRRVFDTLNDAEDYAYRLMQSDLTIEYISIKLGGKRCLQQQQH